MMQRLRDFAWDLSFLFHFMLGRSTESGPGPADSRTGA